MSSPCTTSPSCAARTSRAEALAAERRGSALVIVLLLVCVLSVVAGSLLLTTAAHYHTTFQSASWQESIVGAEAGVDMAMNELRKRIVQGAPAAFATNWTATAPATGAPYGNFGHAFPASNQAYTLSTHAGEGNNAMQARVYVDVPGSSASPTVNFAIPPSNSTATFISELDNPKLCDPDGVDRSRWWYRIRSLGTAGLSGQPVANLQTLDNRLRRFSFYTDWRTGQPVGSPQTSRLVEVTVQPLTNFRNALMADKRIDLSNMDVLIDSYDSSKGPYNSTSNHGQMGNIATNGQLINAAHATVNGDALTDNGSVNAGDNVTGQQSSNFYQELTPLTPGMLNPAWSGVASGGTITSNATYTASTDSTHPTLVRLDGINLPDGGSVVNLNAPTDAATGAPTTSPSFIKLYVQGDIATAGGSYINLAAGVSAIVYFTGNLNVQGYGIINNSFLADQLVLNGIQPPANSDGTFPARSINIATTQDFEGIVYAPNHDLTLALQAVSASSSALAPVAAAGTNSLANIVSLQGQIASVNADIAGNQIAYAQAQAIYTTSGAPGQLARMQAAEAQITADQAKLVLLNQQLNLAGGLNPASSTDDHARGYNGIYGGFVARTIKVSNKTHVHYDETLRQVGPVNHYQIVSWFEDNISRDATGGAEQYWWTSASK